MVTCGEKWVKVGDNRYQSVHGLFGNLRKNIYWGENGEKHTDNGRPYELFVNFFNFCTIKLIYVKVMLIICNTVF